MAAPAVLAKGDAFAAIGITDRKSAPMEPNFHDFVRSHVDNGKEKNRNRETDSVRSQSPNLNVVAARDCIWFPLFFIPLL